MFRFKKLLVLSIFLTTVLSADETYKDVETGITLPVGFKAELLYKVPREQGSWVAMTFDPKGRLIVSDQDDQGVFRVTLSEKEMPKVESLKGFPYSPINWGQRKVGGALGFLYAFDSLYMSTMKGFYRIRDTDGDDKYDEFTLIKKLGVGYEHSAHSIIKSEDGKALYLVVGNHTPLPKGVPSRLPAVWDMDNLIQVMPDAMGHATGIMPPAGFICKISPDGSEWEMVASGLRNSVDMAINREGELFTYDSDLEFDIGCPWYRPTRVNHVISGSEFGWRYGTGKWPEYFADSFGAVVNIGPGSPTGMSFGHHSNFPTYYQDKLFLCDWTFGTIYTVEMTESGSSYSGVKKEFLSGSPLNISAMRFGPDGAMYFIIGGRNTQSALYRIKYVGEPVKGELRQLTKNQELRDLRHKLEANHKKVDDGLSVVKEALPYLSHSDRAIRYAARVAIENQDLNLWQDEIFKISEVRGRIYGLIALSRHGKSELAEAVIKSLNEIEFSTLNEEDKLAILRAYSLCFMRLKPAKDLLNSVVLKLEPHFPAESDVLNTELCRVLSYLNAPSVVRKSIELMKKTQVKTAGFDEEMLKRREEYGQIILKSLANSPNVQNIQYAFLLRQVKAGWSFEDRKYYFAWLNESLKKSGGKSFVGHIKAIRQDAIKHLSEQESKAVSWLLGDIVTFDLAALPNPVGPGQAYTKESVVELFKEPLKNRDFDNGKKMFSAGRCIACHRIEGEGGYSGPDLGSVGSRYSKEDILTAIIEPSKSISEQYQASEYILKNGTSHYGRFIFEDKGEIGIAPSAFMPDQITKFPASDVSKVSLSNLSMMPPGLINGMNPEELKDLIAYLISGGNKKHEFFKK